MQGYSYSIFSGVAIAIHLIINYKLLIGKGEISGRAACYRGFLWGTLAYYLSDAAWGILAGLGWTRTLYVETFFFFLSLFAFVFMWVRFVSTYLKLDKWPKRILSWFGYAILAFNLVALASNPFNKCFFHIDEQGVYRTDCMRDPAFYLLVVMNILTAVFVFMKAYGRRDSVRRRSMMVIMCCITMTAALVLQIIWPLTPFTALGCLISNCFFHAFVIADEQSAKHMAELEKALERARVAERARSMFFSAVSHDIRTPLNAIIGYTELLIGGIPDEQERSKALSGISTSGQTLLQLINDVLDLSKLESGKMAINPEFTDVHELVSSVVRTVEVTVKDSDVELKEEYGPLPFLEIDPQRIRQILFNLVGNAVKFTEHGEICVRASFRKDADDGNGVFTLSVSDTGCGIAEEDKAIVMDPFVQLGNSAKIKGTGLGLPICKQLASSMGGQLSFVSELGKGSTFTLELYDVKSAECLPAADDATAAGQELSDGQPPRRETRGEQKKKIAKQYRLLIVDDVPLNLAVLNALLKKIGVNDVETAVDGQDALEKIRTSKKPFDCVLTDIWMPNMNGKELVSNIRADKHFAGLPVYAVTADVEEQKAFAERGFTGILLKPLTIDKLSGLFK
jgi:signal transduction histidine kinase/CheY-like chemotaxis protein